MSHQSQSPQELFEDALQDYKKKTGVTIGEHLLVKQLQNCDNITKNVTIVLDELRDFSKFSKIMEPVRNIVLVLYRLSTAANLGHAVGLHIPPIEAILSAALVILLSLAKGGIAGYSALVDILRLIENFLNNLDIYTKFPPTGPTDAMTEKVVWILVELLYTLALATKQIRQGRFRKSASKLFRESNIDAVLQRLDRLTPDERRMTEMQILMPVVIHGLVQNMKIVMRDGKASLDNIRVALATMQQVTSNPNKSNRDKVVGNMTSWLFPAGYSITCKQRHEGTAEWFIQDNIFSRWRVSDPGPLLWIHGKPGAGKGVLCSAIIQDIDTMRKAGLASLAIFYFDSMDGQKKDRKDRQGLVSSLLVQLCHQSDSYCDILSSFYMKHSKGVQSPSNDALVGCLKQLLTVPGQAPVYLILDALDRCSNKSASPAPRKGVLELLEELVKSRFPHLRICITSQLKEDIQRVLTPLGFRSVSLHDQSGHKDDIENYITFRVKTDPMTQEWTVDDKERTIKFLKEHADGRFGWVISQLEQIRTQGPRANLSETPNEMYRRILGEIEDAGRELAHCVSQCVAVASRPLHVEEFTEFLAFDFTAPIPKFYLDRRQKENVVPSTHSKLLSTVEVDGSSVIQFLHPSVKEYLVSFHLRVSDTSDTTSPLYHLSKTPAHTRAAQACLGILLHLDPTVTRDSLQKFPLAEYAAEHWVDHFRFVGDQQGVEEGLKCLFNPSKLHLAVAVWIHDPAMPSWRRTERAERPSQQDTGAPLHYAALYGLHRIVKYLIVERQLDVNSRDFDDGSTALHMVSSRGDLEVARLLLDLGAKVKVQDTHGWTPLHQACRRGHAQVAHLLLEKGADPTAQAKHGWTPLHEASSGGHMELVQLLLDYDAPVRTQDEYGWTPHHGASSGGYIELADMLLKHGADAKAQDKPLSLHEALDVGFMDFARVLIEHGADDANTKDEHGLTPLHKASEGENSEVVFLLLEHDADPTAQDEHGSTPLHKASEGGHAEVVSLLLKYDANPTAQDKLGLTPLHQASGRGHVEVTRTLLKHGADTAARDKLSWTPLHGASFGGHVELARSLLDNGAKKTAQDKQGLTPLHLASGRGHAGVAGLLLEKGADVLVGAKDKLGWTPLHRAFSMGDVQVAKVLLDHGANGEVRDKFGQTPLDCAFPGKKDQLRQLLPNPPTEAPGVGHCCTMQ